MLFARFLTLQDEKDPAIISQRRLLSNKEDFRYMERNVDSQLRTQKRTFESDERPDTSVARLTTRVRLAGDSAVQSPSDILPAGISFVAKQNDRLRVCHYIAASSEILYSVFSDKGGASTVSGRITGPGMAFIKEVESRTFGTSVRRNLSSDIDLDNYQRGFVDQQLIEDFAETHPYFASGKLEAEDRELYCEKMAFYFVKRALGRDLGGSDIIASALRLVAECLLRYFRSSIFPTGKDTEVVLIGDENALSKLILNIIKADFPSITIASMSWKDAP